SVGLHLSIPRSAEVFAYSYHLRIEVANPCHNDLIITLNFSQIISGPMNHRTFYTHSMPLSRYAKHDSNHRTRCSFPFVIQELKLTYQIQIAIHILENVIQFGNIYKKCNWLIILIRKEHNSLINDRF